MKPQSKTKVELTPQQRKCAKLAKFGNAAIIAFEKASKHGGKAERPHALCDLLADLMHWADAHKFDFQNELRVATGHYQAERTGDDSQFVKTAYGFDSDELTLLARIAENVGVVDIRARVRDGGMTVAVQIEIDAELVETLIYQRPNIAAARAFLDACRERGAHVTSDIPAPTYDLIEELASEESSEIAKAHIALSDALEDPDKGNDEVRDAAIDVCNALNALQELAKRSKQSEYAVMISTLMVNRKVIKNGTDWNEIRREIANATALKVDQVPMNLVDRLYNHEDLFFDLRMEMHDDPCWFRAYVALLEAGMLVHASDDNDAGEIVRPSTDGVLVTQTQLMEHRMAAHTVRADIINCIADAIEGTYEYVRDELASTVDAIAASKDVLLTLSDKLPHCEWFEVYTKMLHRNFLTRVQ